MIVFLSIVHYIYMDINSSKAVHSHQLGRVEAVNPSFVTRISMS